MGLFYPLSGGLSIANLPGTGSQVSANLQWTLYEAFKLPAVAIRASHSRLQGLQNTSFSSSGVEALSSWGWKNLTIYGGLGAIKNKGYLKSESLGDFEKEQIDAVRTFGLQLLSLKLGLKFNLETRKQNESARVTSIKIGFRT